MSFIFATHVIKYVERVTNKQLLNNLRKFASSSVEATILDKWRKSDAHFPYLGRNILVQSLVKSRDTA